MGRKGLGSKTVGGYGFFVPAVTGRKGLENDVEDTGPEVGREGNSWNFVLLNECYSPVKAHSVQAWLGTGIT